METGEDVIIKIGIKSIRSRWPLYRIADRRQASADTACNNLYNAIVFVNRRLSITDLKYKEHSTAHTLL